MDYSVVELAQQLIQIPSVTPNGKRDQYREERIAKWIAEYMRKAGYIPEFHYVKPYRPNLLIRHQSHKKNLATLALEAHLDTVDVQRMTVEPFAAKIRNVYLWGKGACDVKGTMAAMINAMNNWYYNRDNPTFNIIFMASVGEEAGTLGARAWAEMGLEADMILVAEPTRPTNIFQPDN